MKAVREHRVNRSGANGEDVCKGALHRRGCVNSATMCRCAKEERAWRPHGCRSIGLRTTRASPHILRARKPHLQRPSPFFCFGDGGGEYHERNAERHVGGRHLSPLFRRVPRRFMFLHFLYLACAAPAPDTLLRGLLLSPPAAVPRVGESSRAAAMMSARFQPKTHTHTHTLKSRCPSHSEASNTNACARVFVSLVDAMSFFFLSEAAAMP